IELTAPVERCGGELDRSLVFTERDVGEGQCDRGEMRLRCGVERRRKLRVVECGALVLRRRIDDDELITAGDRTTIPEAVRLADPRGAFGHVYCEALKARVELLGACVVGRSALSSR